MVLFCRKIIINDTSVLKKDGPLLIACNHPNSFLDAVILDALFDKPIWSLARGDVFRNKLIIKILTALRILPVYRVSEGVENLGHNYQTFRECQQLFGDRQIVLIFSEGRCVNEWHLRPLKKGTARLAISTWEDTPAMEVLPVGINYHSFRRFGKIIHIKFGEIIRCSDTTLNAPDGIRIREFNQLLTERLQPLVYEIDGSDTSKQKEFFSLEVSPVAQALLFIPAIIGWILHAPLYYPLRAVALKRAAHNDHFDSVLTALLLVSYPLYLSLFVVIAFLFTGSALVLFIIPLMFVLAWCAINFRQPGYSQQ